ncbi:MAG TPA: acyl-CoA dehydrogenase family protein [Myxococcota bacterium]|nr:acyl-CoA dehydrogenase family protein [Myxococcota bacterium]
MNFALSEEQEQLRHQAREILSRECPTSRVRKLMESETAFDPDLARVFAEAGWLGVLVPEELGGAGLSLLDAVVLLGEMGRAVVPGPFLASSVAATLALRHAGSRAQQKVWLPRIAKGEAVATLALVEGPEPRFDGVGVRARARPRADGFRLDGTKLFVDAANSADLVLAAFRVGAPPREAKPAHSGGFGGVALFAVERSAPGLAIEALVSLDETRRSCEVRFSNVRVGREAVLPRSAAALARVLDGGAIAVAAECLGGAERALELAVEYVRAREQFGRPVGSFQAVQHLAAEAVAAIEPARALLWHAGWAFESRPREAPLAAAMAKVACAEVFRAVSRTAIEMFGGIGFTFENDMHLYFKRALANGTAFGDASFHRERVAQLAGF